MLAAHLHPEPPSSPSTPSKYASRRTQNTAGPTCGRGRARAQDGGKDGAGACRTARCEAARTGERGAPLELERGSGPSAGPLMVSNVKQARIAGIDAQRAVAPFLVDTFQRQHDYLRVSLTESEGVELSPNGNILTDDEVVRLAGLFVQNGVRKIRLTGGEPTVRKGLVDIVARLNELRQHGLEAIGMTTNGIALHRRLPELVAHGLTHLNISLDTLDPFKFEIMTRRMGHEAVLRSVDVALSSSLSSVKLNVVVIKGLNDAEVLDFVELTKTKALSVRFIEFMPFTGNKWDKHKMVPSSELLARIASKYPDVTKAPDELNDTARSYVIPGHLGSFGFISSMSDHFCGSCNRLRLTADGQIKVCLFDPKEISLRDPMRLGASDAQLLQIIGRAVQGKRAKHAGMEDIDTGTLVPLVLVRNAHRGVACRLTSPDPVQLGLQAVVFLLLERRQEIPLRV
ncbi:hypothetical protein EIP86_002238 [Pleurotus ostreatoroseus]|nr:hypothetical protein EIP86_002238 [Pleurotus ostreatoroseus]